MYPANEVIIRKHLNTNIPRIIIKESLDSTNTYLKELSKEASTKTVVIANTQTKGRGRTGNSFFSPEGGLYMSILLPFEPEFQKTPGLVTAFAAVSVCRAIEKITDKSPKIKWVNDIYLENKKICGILTEATSDKNIILGIGINIIPPENGFPDDIKNKAGSLFLKRDVPKDIKSILAAGIINNLINTISDKKYSSYTEEYKKRSMLTGKKVSYLKNNVEKHGIVLGIDDNLHLLINNDGNTETLSSGEIKLTEWK